MVWPYIRILNLMPPIVYSMFFVSVDYGLKRVLLPTLGNLADVVYLKEQCFLLRMRDVHFALCTWWHNVVTTILIYPLFILIRKGMYFNNSFIINE